MVEASGNLLTPLAAIAGVQAMADIEDLQARCVCEPSVQTKEQAWSTSLAKICAAASRLKFPPDKHLVAAVRGNAAAPNRFRVPAAIWTTNFYQDIQCAYRAEGAPAQRLPKREHKDRTESVGQNKENKGGVLKRGRQERSHLDDPSLMFLLTTHAVAKSGTRAASGAGEGRCDLRWSDSLHQVVQHGPSFAQSRPRSGVWGASCTKFDVRSLKIGGPGGPRRPLRGVWSRIVYLFATAWVVKAGPRAPLDDPCRAALEAQRYSARFFRSPLDRRNP